MLRVSCVLLLAVAANALTNTGHFRSWYAYDVTVAGAHDIALRGMTCKNSFVNLLVLNSVSATSDGESLEDAAKTYLSYENGPQVCAANTYTAAGGIAGTCKRRILKQDTITTTPIDMGDIVRIASDTDTTASPFHLQIQFAADDMEACTNVAATAATSAHAGHGHRRAGGHATGAFTFEANFLAVGRYFFYSDQDLASYEFAINPEGLAAYPVALREVLADPNICSATPVLATTCKCDCDDDKYMWSGIILFIGLLGMAPVIFRQLATSEKLATLLSLFNCFGGGTLLTVAITHVFPEALDLYPSKSSGDYPVAAMLCAAGYWIILMADKVLLSLCAPEPEPEQLTADPPSLGVGHGHGAKPKGSKTEDAENPLGDVMIDLGSKSQPAQGHGIGAEPCTDDHSPTTGNMWHVVGVFLSMALHSVLAGLAVGLKCEKSSMENLCIAICCHKAFDVFAVGILLVRAEAPLIQAFPVVVIVALMTPIGVWIGVAGESVDIEVNGSLQAVAAGTFLYVAIQEVLATEFARPGHMVAKGFATLGGIAVIALASIANTNGGHSDH